LPEPHGRQTGLPQSVSVSSPSCSPFMHPAGTVRVAVAVGIGVSVGVGGTTHAVDYPLKITLAGMLVVCVEGGAVKRPQ
jgi:hypothetical protein